MVELIEDGNGKKFISTCIHCISDFSFETEDIKRNILYEYKNGGGRTIFSYAICCPQCKVITSVNFGREFKK